MDEKECMDEDIKEFTKLIEQSEHIGGCERRTGIDKCTHHAG